MKANKKQKQSPSSTSQHNLLLLSQLPHALLNLIFTYCDETDLFYTIPLVCSSFSKTLKRVVASEAQISNILIECAGTEKEELENFIRKHTATQENLFWKNLVLEKAPSLKLVQNDLLFSYKRVYARSFEFGVERPPHYLHCEIESVFQLLTREKQKLLKIGSQDAEQFYNESQKNKENKEEEEEEKNSILEQAADHHREMFENQFEVLRKVCSRLMNVGRPEIPEATSYHHGDTLMWFIPRYPQKFNDIIMFLQDTAIVKVKECITEQDGGEGSTNSCFVKLFSPINGTSVRIEREVKYQGMERSQLFSKSFVFDLEFSLYDALERQVGENFGAKETSVVVVTPAMLWKVVKHLELDKLIVSSDKVEMGYLLSCIWYDVIEAGLFHDPTEVYFEGASSKLTYTGPKAPKSAMPAFERFKAFYNLEAEVEEGSPNVRSIHIEEYEQQRKEQAYKAAWETYPEHKKKELQLAERTESAQYDKELQLFKKACETLHCSE